MTEGSNLTRKKRSSSLRRRSKSQNKHSVHSESEREHHLQLLETRLDKAKEARPPPYQSHVHFLEEIPDYSNLPEAFHHPLGTSISRVPRTSMMSELETSKYFWDRGSPQIGSKLNESYQNVLPTSNLIPSSTIYLDTDLPGVLSKLEEIRVNLKELREQRLTMPTAEYFRTYAPDLKSHYKPESSQPFSRSSYYGNPENANIPSLAEIRAKILNMDLNVEIKTREILNEAYRRQIKVIQRREIPIDRDVSEGMPEWLKKTENFVEKMEKEEDKELEEVLKINQKQDEVQEKTEIESNKVAVSTKSEDEKTESVVIAPTRTIVFNTSKPLVSLTKNEPDKPTSEFAKVADQEGLSLMSQEAPKLNPQGAAKPLTLGSQLSPPAPSKKESSSYSKMLELLNFGGGTNLGAKMQPTGKDDSDDDFFN
ncbi:hypothetical protein FO519_009226 [Halicephalobus sp. NKZ332]|nr:hypothetical protein FO519_009226 [Halicephalobus sp. NKZ332]